MTGFTNTECVDIIEFLTTELNAAFLAHNSVFIISTHFLNFIHGNTKYSLCIIKCEYESPD